MPSCWRRRKELIAKYSQGLTRRPVTPAARQPARSSGSAPLRCALRRLAAARLSAPWSASASSRAGSPPACARRLRHRADGAGGGGLRPSCRSATCIAPTSWSTPSRLRCAASAAAGDGCASGRWSDAAIAADRLGHGRWVRARPVANGTTTMMLGIPIGWAMALTVPLGLLAGGRRPLVGGGPAAPSWADERLHSTAPRRSPC